MNLKEIRKSKNISQDELASKVGVVRQTIVNYENGTVPKREMLLKLAEVLECTPDEIVGEHVYSMSDLKPIKAVSPKDEMERELLDRFRELAFDDKLKVFKYLESLKK